MKILHLRHPIRKWQKVILKFNYGDYIIQTHVFMKGQSLMTNVKVMEH
jgi:hypothetical protein